MSTTIANVGVGKAHSAPKLRRGVTVEAHGHSLWLVVSDGETHTIATLVPADAKRLAVTLSRAASRLRKSTKNTGDQ